MLCVQCNKLGSETGPERDGNNSALEIGPIPPLAARVDPQHESLRSVSAQPARTAFRGTWGRVCVGGGLFGMEGLDVALLGPETEVGQVYSSKSGI